jgi:hypothetical protein
MISAHRNRYQILAAALLFTLLLSCSAEAQTPTRLTPSAETIKAPAPPARVAFAALPFVTKLRVAYERKYQVMLRASALLRDGHDRCLTDNCRSLPAGEIIMLDSPYILSVMGRPSLRVRHGKQLFYVPAEEPNFAFSEMVAPVSPTLLGQVLSVRTKVKNAFSLTKKR